MLKIVLGVIGILFGIVAIVMQATGAMGHDNNGYFVGAVFIFFGILRIARGLNQG